MDIHQKFQQLRKQKGVSVYKLSKITDISENHIHSIERGESQPSVMILERLLDALGSNLAEFFNDDSAVLYPTSTEREIIGELRRLDENQINALLQLTKTMK